jgi:uncharacterized membrane protein (UPF0127 family)
VDGAGGVDGGDIGVGWAHAKGLRFRQTRAENAGMLFVFPAPQRVSFWMKDASISLSIGVIQSDGKIVQIRPMQPYDETPVPSLSDTVAYALLVNQGSNATESPRARLYRTYPVRNALIAAIAEIAGNKRERRR